MSGPVLFAIDPIPREILMSLVTRVAADNVLPSSHVILEQVGAPHAHNPTAAIAPDLDEVKLAHILRLPVKAVSSRRHAPTGDPGFVDLLGAAVRADELVFRHRRFSPTAVTRSPHIRATWSHKMVPCCTESWEYLVDRCLCGAEQAWRAAYYLDRCDRCCMPLALAPTEKVAPPLRVGLKFILGLLGTSDEDAVAARGRLPPDLAGWNGGLVFELALALMPLTPSGYTPDRGRPVPQADRVAFATALSQTADLIHAWPGSMLGAIDVRVSERSRSKVNVRYRGPSEYFAGLDSELTPACVRRAIMKALGGLAAEAGSTPPDQIGMRDAALMTGQEERRLAMARREGLLVMRTSLRHNRLVPSLDRSEIERLDDFLANRMGPDRSSTKLGLPQYAIKLLADRKLLQLETHPYVIRHYGPDQVHRDELTSFVDRLRDALKRAPDGEATILEEKEELTKHPVHLHRVVRAMGGGLKPWGRILEALISKQVSFQMTGPSIKGIRIGAADASVIQSWPCEPTPPIAERCSQRDAVEILNLPLKHTRRLPDGVADEAGCSVAWEPLLNLARDEITLAELSARTGVHPTRLEHQLSCSLAPFIGAIGWQRHAALAAIARLKPTRRALRPL